MPAKLVGKATVDISISRNSFDLLFAAKVQLRTYMLSIPVRIAEARGSEREATST